MFNIKGRTTVRNGWESRVSALYISWEILSSGLRALAKSKYRDRMIFKSEHKFVFFVSQSAAMPLQDRYAFLVSRLN